MVRSSVKAGYALFVFLHEKGYDAIMKKVAFTGHSTLAPFAESTIKKELDNILEKLIAEGASEFLFGGYGRFDSICAVTIREMKKKYPHITSILVIPYLDRNYDETLYDSSEYPALESVPKRFAISKRNEYMMKEADVVIAYVDHSFGGAYTAYKYAIRQNKTVYNLAISE